MSGEEKPVEVHVDLSGIMEKLNELERKLTGSKGEMGKGEVSAPKENRYAKILEMLKNRSGTIREQWEAPISLPVKSTASLMSFVFRSDEVRGNLGDTVSIPYVRAFDADILTNVGDPLTAKTGLYGIVQTTLKEAAATTDIPYADVEKLSEELLEELEAQFKNAIIRAIDKAILDAIIADPDIPELDKSLLTVAFDADWIPEALMMIASQGKTLTPGDYVLVLGPKAYHDLYKDIVGAQALVYARPDVVREGLVAEFMGVPIVISQYLPEHASGKVSCFLIHRNSIAFAPKREMLFETERDTQGRKVKLTGSYTFGVAVVDDKAICEIKTYTTA